MTITLDTHMVAILVINEIDLRFYDLQNELLNVIKHYNCA